MRGAGRLKHLRLGLEARRGELESAALVRVHSISAPDADADPAYANGLRAAVSDALDYALEGIEHCEDVPAPVPVSLLAQARLAARNGVGLDTVLHRYVAGHTLFSDSLLAEAECHPVSAGELKMAMRSLSARLDRVVTAIPHEYAQEEREAQERCGNAEHRRIERVRMLLAGKLVDLASLDYDLDGWHLGLIASGPGSREAARVLGTAMACRLLWICGESGSLWAWLGSGDKRSAQEASDLAETRWPAGSRVAFGEPGRGLDGWRLTHHQAKAAFAVALRARSTRVRHADVALLAAALRDEVLASSLCETYLAPLEEERDGGMVLRQTLATYFATGRNASSAAAALGVSRNTVSVRLRSVEERIGRPLERCAAELETAVSLRELRD